MNSNNYNPVSTQEKNAAEIENEEYIKKALSKLIMSYWDGKHT